MRTCLLPPDPETWPTLNEIVRLSKGHWGYDEIFMEKFMATYGVSKDYLQRSQTFILKDGEEILGFYGFSHTDEGLYELDYFFLLPPHMGKGWGRLMWEYALETCRESGEREFVFWSDPFAEDFYLKMGCVRLEYRPSHIVPGRHVPFMKKELGPS